VLGAFRNARLELARKARERFDWLLDGSKAKPSQPRHLKGWF